MAQKLEGITAANSSCLKDMPVFSSGANLLDGNHKALQLGAQEYAEEDEALIADSLNWRKHITLRASLVGAAVGIIGGIMYLQISLLSPITPSLNVVYSLFSFIIIRSLVNMSCSKLEFTKQENTIAQTLAMTASAGSQNLGYSTWFGAMMPVLGMQDGFTLATVDTNSFGLLIGTSMSVLFPGIFLMTFMTKYFATNEKLPFPSGTAAGVTLNSFHNGSKKAQEMVGKQLNSFSKFFSFSFVWTMLTSVFAVPLGSACGNALPIFGPEIAAKFYGWGNWDYQMIYTGVGMMLSPDFVWSVVVGMILNCFWFKPWIAEHGYDAPYPDITEPWNQTDIPDYAWYSTSKVMMDGAKTPPMRMAYGYKVFMFALVLLGEGFYVIGKCMVDAYRMLKEKKNTAEGEKEAANEPEAEVAVAAGSNAESSVENVRTAYRRMAIMDRGQPIEKKWALLAFLLLGAAATVVMTLLYDVIWFMVLISFFIIAPLFAVPNVYFIGLQDQDVSAILGKIPMFLMPMAAAAYYGDAEKAIIPGLVAEGAIIGICGQTGLLMQDFRTAYLTETSPKAMFVGQIIGACVASVMGPLTWLLFNHAFPVIGESGRFATLANAPAYRAIATVGAYGVEMLPKHCLSMCLVGCAIGFVLAALRDHIPSKLGEKYGWIFNYVVVSPTALALAVYMDTGNGNSDYPVGAAIGVMWKFFSAQDYKDYYPIVAAALISGASIATLVGGVISIFGADPAIYCLSFGSAPL